MTWNLIANSDKRKSKETVLLKPSAGGDVRVALGYPNTYKVGMSNLGLQVVYALFNMTPGVTCERFFLPDSQEMADYKSCGRRLFTIESQRPVSDFDVVAFSVAYEQDYVNFLTLLDLAGLPIFSKDRTDDHPLVVIGGAITLLNPEPLADFTDAVCIGDGELFVSSLIKSLRSNKGAAKSKVLRMLAEETGSYIPAFFLDDHPQIKRQFLDKESYENTVSSSQILTEDTELSNSGLVELSRGCAFRCRFCTVGFSYPKIRWKSLDRIWDSIENLLKYTKKIGIISATAGNYPYLPELCQRLTEHNATVAFSSLRVDGLPDVLLELLVKGGAKTITLAPEVGSDLLRKAANKHFTDEQYLETASRAFSAGIKNIRMYAMVGLPGEKEEHLQALVDLCAETRKVQVQSGHSSGRLTLSVGQFIPKPQTPFQWSGMLESKEVNRRLKFLEKNVNKISAVNFAGESPKWALIQGLLARGDRRYSKVLARVYKDISYNNWLKALADEGIDYKKEAFSPRNLDEPLPWEVFTDSLSRSCLLKDRDKAQEIIDKL